MKIQISVSRTESDDVLMFTELTARVPALRQQLRIGSDGYVLEVEGDRARYLVALMNERLAGTEEYEAWQARNTGVVHAHELMRLGMRQPTTIQPRLGEK